MSIFLYIHYIVELYYSNELQKHNKTLSRGDQQNMQISKH